LPRRHLGHGERREIRLTFATCMVGVAYPMNNRRIT
jgi:hypothetical protein